MRIPIAVQLALLVLLTTLSGIAVLAIATWITTYNFVVGVESQGLELVATIKASQIASNLELIEVTCKTISTRLLVQAALERYNNGNTSATNWVNSISDIQSALGSRGYLDLYQASLYSSQGGGSTGDGRLLNVTSDTVPQINLPYTYENGTAVTLGDSGLGYPPALYPNVTYTTSQEGNATVVQAFPDYPLGLTSALLLGPLTVNDSFSLVSLTVPIINNTSTTDILGYLTVVASAVNVQNILSSRDGMGDTGQVLLLGPSRAQNTFASDAQPATATSSPDTAGLEAALVHYVFEPTTLPKQTNRHPNVSTSDSFSLSKYKIALKLMLESYGSRTAAIHDLSTKNEKGYTVAVGAIRPETSLVEWILVVEESHDEAFHPVFRLRKIIIGCVFGTAGLIILIIPLMARWAVAPIRRLREAAKKSVIPEFSPEPPVHHGRNIFGISNHILAHGNDPSVTEKGPSFLTRRLRAPSEQAGNLETVTTQHTQRDFQVPSRVKERRNCITDELTDLTRTFNEMSDELTIQYNRLEERVIERTRELEKAKLAAETANESKTLFIANISHELKTPLNGILGMCAVCMGEDDLSRIKRSLKVVYQSGDLLLHLLNDLLTFSKNQIDQAIQLDEKEFRLSDIRAQLGIIFQKQVHEKQIDFNIHYTNTEIQGSETVTETFCLDPDSHVGLPLKPVHGRLMDMVLLGDQHRILQVLINLVSNSLKFTPENGKVDVWIRCLGESSLPDGPTAFNHDTRGRLRQKSRSLDSQISALDQSKSVIQTTGKDLFGEPPYGRALMFEFEVRDNGPGIPRNLHRRIFDPFVQGDLGLNRKYGGTGLGLSICAQLSRIMNGTILLESEEGKGSTFTLRIPLGFVKELAPSSQFSSNAGSRSPSPLSLEFATVARPSTQGSTKSEPVAAPSFEKADGQPRLVGLSQPFFAPTVPPSPQSASSVSTPRNIQSGANGNSPRRIRVLVAEDNTVNQEVVRRMLALEEVYDVTMVKDGQEAYDIVRLNMETGSVFDLIFMDIQMPNLDGLQSTRLIREMGYSAPIVALSAFAEESNKKDCIESGMDMFISKPIRRPALKQVLNKFATIIEESEPGLAE